LTVVFIKTLLVFHRKAYGIQNTALPQAHSLIPLLLILYTVKEKKSKVSAPGSAKTRKPGLISGTFPALDLRHSLYFHQNPPGKLLHRDG
jgi:hypothetical protein